MTIRCLSSIDDDTSRVLSEASGLLLSAARDFHVFHLLSANHAEHVVLGDIYNLCTTSADKLAEQTRGHGYTLHLDRLNGTYVDAAVAPSDYLFQVLTRLTSYSMALNPQLPVANTLTDVIASLSQQRTLLMMTNT